MSLKNINADLDLQNRLLNSKDERMGQASREVPLDLDFINRLFQADSENEPSGEDINVILTPVNMLFGLVMALSSFLYYRLD
jgi:hypothetical protein